MNPRVPSVGVPWLAEEPVCDDAPIEECVEGGCPFTPLCGAWAVSLEPTVVQRRALPERGRGRSPVREASHHLERLCTRSNGVIGEQIEKETKEEMTGLTDSSPVSRGLVGEPQVVSGACSPPKEVPIFPCCCLCHDRSK